MADKGVRKLIQEEAVIEVTRTIIKDRRLPKEDQEKKYSHLSKRIKIRPFVTDPAHVSIKYGLTIPTIEYGGARVDVMISCPCYVEEMVDVFGMVQEMADGLIDVEANKIEGEDEE